MKKINKKNKIQLFIFTLVFFIIITIGYAILSSPNLGFKLQKYGERYLVINNDNNNPDNNSSNDDNKNNTQINDDNKKSDSGDNKKSDSSGKTNDKDMKADVIFKETDDSPKIISGTGTAYIDETKKTAYFDLTGFSRKGNTAVVNYTILNDSKDYDCSFNVNIKNSNPTYYKITYVIGKRKLEINETTEINIIVELIKTPIEKEEKTSFSVTITSTPIEK